MPSEGIKLDLLVCIHLTLALAKTNKMCTVQQPKERTRITSRTTRGSRQQWGGQDGNLRLAAGNILARNIND